ncbi:MAG: DNA adenine methylase [Anaerolineaceae bacterium]|nr:DNA adenine methylase [Anaerolineaceae bacterium]
MVENCESGMLPQIPARQQALPLAGAQSMFSPRAAFLARLRGKGRYPYRRYMGLPLRYAGGKSLAVGHIVEQLPETVTQLVSPFFGGGSVEIACAKELGISVRGSDVFDILTNYWQVQLREPGSLADRISQWAPTKENYAAVKERLKAHWNGTEPIHNPLELAAHYWFNHNLSYGPGFLGWMSKIYEDTHRYERLLEKVRAFRCANLAITQGSFEKVIPEYRAEFLYCDPPYYLAGDSRMFRGIYPQRNFPVHHRGFDHVALRDLLHQHDSGFILSYNDCQTIRKWYADFRIVEVAWQYTLGQGETRIGKNRIENGTKHHVKRSHELLIVKDG